MGGATFGRERQRLTVRVTAFNRPQHFQDIMVAGAFKSMRHDHEFFEHPNGTLMVDRFEFQSPFGILGNSWTGSSFLPTCVDSSSAATVF
jgi:ligand-binding SRPBCC domain-containing protein